LLVFGLFGLMKIRQKKDQLGLFCRLFATRSTHRLEQRLEIVQARPAGCFTAVGKRMTGR
jgi:hypothetical protein